MTASKATEHLVEPIEAWLRQFDELELRSAPEDFLVGLGSIRKAFVDFYEEGAAAAPMQLLTSLAACEFTLAEEAQWVRDRAIAPLQPLSPHWLPLVATRAPEMRLAIALNALRPIETGNEIVTVRSHMESIRTAYVADTPPDASFDDELGYSRRTEVSWRHGASKDRVWDKQNDVDGLAAVLRRRLHADYAPFEHAGRGQIPASLGDIDAFIQGRTQEDTFSRLAFVLSMIDLAVVEMDFDVAESHDAPIDPDFALLKLALSRPEASEDAGRVPIKRDIHLVALRGDRESTRTFARAHLRAHGIAVRDDLPESDADFERVVAACAFPLSEPARRRLRDFLAEG
jgi:CRISPR-associated protein Csx17